MFRDFGLDVNSIIRVRYAIIDTLTQANKLGHTYLHIDDIKSDLSINLGVNEGIILNELLSFDSIINYNFNIYLNSTWHLKDKLVKELCRIINTPQDVDPNFELNLGRPLNYYDKINDKQKLAIVSSLTNNLSIISGPAGSGKSYIASVIQDLCGTSKIAFCAPTGKACNRLQPTINGKVRTIHHLLGFNGKLYKYNAGNKLPYDVVYVDEVSMVDYEVALRFFEAIKDGTKVILTGDYNQLQSIGLGDFLYDLISSKSIPHIELDTIHRQLITSTIIYNSQRLLFSKSLCMSDDFAIFNHMRQAKEEVFVIA